jgi:small subunit ribosomal protein S4
MSRYRGPKIRIVRRLGELPGLTTKTTTRDTLPGQHRKARGKQNNASSYSVRLQEKQKLRYHYGLSEKKLLSYVKEARRLKGSTGSVLLQLLEMRLDNIVYRLGIGNTIPASRQIVNHGHIYVNGKKVTIPSFQCLANDVIEVRDKKVSKELANQFLEKLGYNTLPDYLEFEKETLKGKVKRIAENTETNLQVNELLIVEYYSRR